MYFDVCFGRVCGVFLRFRVCKVFVIGVKLIIVILILVAVLLVWNGFLMFTCLLTA